MVTSFNLRPGGFFNSRIFCSVMCFIIISDPFGLGFVRTLYHSYISSLSFPYHLLCHCFHLSTTPYILRLCQICPSCDQFDFFNILSPCPLSPKVIHIHCRQIQKKEKSPSSHHRLYFLGTVLDSCQENGFYIVCFITNF